jgi:hypothetical protein
VPALPVPALPVPTLPVLVREPVLAPADAETEPEKPLAAVTPAGTAAVAATGAARPQTLQYPSSIVPPQLVHVLIAAALPSSLPP